MKPLLLAATLITLTFLSCSKDQDQYQYPNPIPTPNCTDPGPDTRIYEGRWSGTFSGGSSGTWIYDVCANGTLTGSGTPTNGVRLSKTGTVSESGLVNVTISNGGSNTGQFNAETGVYTGTWQNNSSTNPLSGTSIGTKE